MNIPGSNANLAVSGDLCQCPSIAACLAYLLHAPCRTIGARPRRAFHEPEWRFELIAPKSHCVSIVCPELRFIGTAACCVRSATNQVARQCLLDMRFWSRLSGGELAHVPADFKDVGPKVLSCFAECGKRPADLEVLPPGASVDQRSNLQFLPDSSP